jgi:hypothetical protein
MTILIKLLLDTLILIVLAMIHGRQTRPKYFRLLLGALLVALAFTVCDEVLDWLPGYMLAVPMLLAAGFVLKAFGRLKLGRAALASVLFVLIHVLIAWLLK